MVWWRGMCSQEQLVNEGGISALASSSAQQRVAPLAAQGSQVGGGWGQTGTTPARANILGRCHLEPSALGNSAWHLKAAFIPGAVQQRVAVFALTAAPPMLLWLCLA
jgi:hypothetical protein